MRSSIKALYRALYAKLCVYHKLTQNPVGITQPVVTSILESQFLYPHQLFTFTERAVWRSFWSATPENENIILPSLAEW